MVSTKSQLLCLEKQKQKSFDKNRGMPNPSWDLLGPNNESILAVHTLSLNQILSIPSRSVSISCDNLLIFNLLLCVRLCNILCVWAFVLLGLEEALTYFPLLFQKNRYIPLPPIFCLGISPYPPQNFFNCIFEQQFFWNYQRIWRIYEPLAY